MIPYKICTFCALLFLISACETKDEVATRLAQFNGKTLAHVTDVIGPPTIQNKTTAVWYHESIHTEYRPYYAPYRFGHRHGFGYGYGLPLTYRLKCSFTAKLKTGRVVSSTYQGNSCQRFAPKPIKKPTS